MGKYDKYFNYDMSEWQIECIYVKLLKKDMSSEDKKILAETANKYAIVALERELKFSFENDLMM